MSWLPDLAASSDVGSLLSVEDLTVAFGGVRAVDRCAFVVKSGVTFLVGPNGAGKSTTMASIAGSVTTRSGSIRFDGKALKGPVHQRVSRGVVRTFQLPQEFGSMTVLENVMVAVPAQVGKGLLSALFFFRRQKHDEATQELARESLRVCGLTHMALERASKLSGGQKKLLEVARALACRPRLLLLDEPTAGVSPVLSEQLIRVLEIVRSRGVSMLIVTHEMSMVEALGGTVIVMANGKVLAEGSLREIQLNPQVQEVYLGRVAEAV